MLRADMGVWGVADTVVFGLIVCSAITDIRSGRIYNKVTYPAIAFGLLWSWFPWSSTTVAASFEGFLIAAILLGGLTLVGGMGGGDAKLMAALGAIKGYPFVVNDIFYSFLVGGAMALAVAIWQGRLYSVLKRVFGTLMSVLKLRSVQPAGLSDIESYKIPFGVAICVGTLWTQLNQAL